MSPSDPTHAALWTICDPRTGLQMYLPGLTEDAARYVAWRTWFASVDDDVPCGRQAQAELARLDVEPVPAGRRAILSTDLVWTGDPPQPTQGRTAQ